MHEKTDLENIKRMYILNILTHAIAVMSYLVIYVLKEYSENKIRGFK